MPSRLARFALYLAAVVAGPAHAVVGSCTLNFPDGLQSQYSGNAASRGTIEFGYNAQLLGSPDKVLNAKRITRNSGSTLGTCGPGSSIDNCTANTSSAAPTRAMPPEEQDELERRLEVTGQLWKFVDDGSQTSPARPRRGFVEES